MGHAARVIQECYSQIGFTIWSSYLKEAMLTPKYAGGRGALDLCRAAGIPESNLLKWDLAETAKKDGPYPEIRESDVRPPCHLSPIALF